MADHSFRRRSRSAGAAVLLDESVSLFQSDPLRWLAYGLLPTLPLALLALLFVHAHRVWWIERSWSGWVPVGSVALSVAVVLAWQLRAVGHGRLAREVIATLHPTALEVADDGTRAGGRLSLVSLTTIGAAGTLVASAMLVLPGLAVAGFLVPVGVVAAVERRDAAAAIARANRFPKGTTGKGMMTVVFFGLLFFCAWWNVMLGTQVGILGVRMILGVDVTVASRVFGFGNEAFVLGSGVVALLLLDPLWGIQKALIYLDARLGQSGMDLQERWRALPGRRRGARAEGAGVPQSAAAPADPGRFARPPGGGSAAILLVGSALWVLALGAPAVAEAAVDPAVAAELEWYADVLDGYRQPLDSARNDYEQSSFEDLSSLKQTLEAAPRKRLVLPDGSAFELELAPLAEDLPGWIHTPQTAEQARRVSERLGAGAELLRALADPGRPAPEKASDPSALLEAELEAGEYDVDTAARDGQQYREGVQDRFRAWWERFVRSMQRDRSPTPAPQTGTGPILPSFDGRVIMAIVAAILGIVLLVLILTQSLRIVAVAPELPRGVTPPGSDLPDARQRSPLGWREHADLLAAEGLFREAIRAQFLAVLARLDRTREIDYRPERTNGEHLRTFRGAGGRRRSLEDATWRFELAWYGGAGADSEDYAAMTASCDALILEDPGGFAASPARFGEAVAEGGG